MASTRPPRPRAPATPRRQRSEPMRRVYRRRRLTVVGVGVGVVTVVAWVAAGPTTGGGSPPAAAAVPSIEAGLEPWQLPSPVSRESVSPAAGGLTVLGGL